MKIISTTIITGGFFAVLLVCSGFMQLELKSNAQLVLLIWGLLTLVTMVRSSPFHTRLPFVALMMVMTFMTLMLLMDIILKFAFTDDGWVVDAHGHRRRVMQMNWIWGLIVGGILGPVIALFYHKKIEKNRTLEISMVILFLAVTGTLYIRDLLQQYQ